MSNTQRSIRGILAVATLAAGFSSLGVGSAGAVTHCQGGSPLSVLQGPNNLAALCEEKVGLRAVAASTRKTPQADEEAAVAMEQLARNIGLEGLSEATAVLSFADMGGAAAGAGVPSLPVPSATRERRAQSRPADVPRSSSRLAGTSGDGLGLPVTGPAGTPGDLGDLTGLGGEGTLPALPALPAVSEAGDLDQLPGVPALTDRPQAENLPPVTDMVDPLLSGGGLR